jgi:sulfide:quinone oxidoreductase
MSNAPRVVILGAGFAGLELATRLSEAFGDRVAVDLIDEADAFVFGYSKLDVMFGRTHLDAVRLPYARLDKPGVTWRRERVTAIDARARTVTTSGGSYEADHLVIALGADYDIDGTPGLAGNEFYSVEGAARLATVIDSFAGGHVVVGVCGAPFKCPPAPSECVLLMHDHLVQRGVREASEITFVIPFGTPVPPSPDTSEALLSAFAERGIRFVGGHRIARVDGERGVAVLDDDSELEYDLFLGVPRHRAAQVTIDSGLTEEGYIKVASRTLETGFPGVYACGDVATVGVPKAGVFSEGQAATVAEAIIAAIRGDDPDARYGGTGSCYIEFGGDRIGRVDVDFLNGPKPTGVFQVPSPELRAEKQHFGASRRARWFGLP